VSWWCPVEGCGGAAASWRHSREMARLLCRPVLGDGAGTGSALSAGLRQDFGGARTGAGLSKFDK
jgi:hypothetical protein